VCSAGGWGKIECGEGKVKRAESQVWKQRTCEERAELSISAWAAAPAPPPAPAGALRRQRGTAPRPSACSEPLASADGKLDGTEWSRHMVPTFHAPLHQAGCARQEQEQSPAACPAARRRTPGDVMEESENTRSSSRNWRFLFLA
jgi:hypothetical protein